MNRLIIISTILLLSNISFGQKNKISIGLLGSLDKFNSKPVTGSNYECEINTAYSFGLNVKYNLAKRLFIKVGGQYSKREYKLDYNFIFTESGDPLIPRETTNELNYIGIPLFMGYDLYNGDKFKIAPSFGLLNEILFSDNETTIFEDNSEIESDFLRQALDKIIFSYQFNLAFSYHFADRLYLSFEPYLRFGFIAYNNEPYPRFGFDANDVDIFDSNSMSYGGVLSINYKLR